MSNLVIIESPTKATNLKSYLGSGYKVMASVGHVRDLPKSSLAVDTENGFQAHFINIRGKGELIKELQKESKKASTVFLATDPDREGEAIAWHLLTALKLDPKKAKRITFNEVTKQAVKTAIKHPRAIDMDLVNSQMARRILDRIVGYKLSPYLWKTVRSGISAGRVQSVATRIIVEREDEISRFVPKQALHRALFRQKREKRGDRRRRNSREDRARRRNRALHRRFGEKSAENPSSRAALHDLHAPAGRKQKARLLLTENDEGRAGAL